MRRYKLRLYYFSNRDKDTKTLILSAGLKNVDQLTPFETNEGEVCTY